MAWISELSVEHKQQLNCRHVDLSQFNDDGGGGGEKMFVSATTIIMTEKKQRNC